MQSGTGTSTRDSLVETAKELLWRDGFEAMSPRKVLQESGAGQGSLYHHFSGKKDLALEALTLVCDEMIAETDRLLAGDAPPLDRLQRYLCKDRKGLKGCRLGRLANETAFQDKELRQPLARYFRHVRRRLVACLSEAIDGGALSSNCDPSWLADTIMSTIQGGYALNRATNNSKTVKHATLGLWSLIESQIRQHKP